LNRGKAGVTAKRRGDRQLTHGTNARRKQEEEEEEEGGKGTGKLSCYYSGRYIIKVTDGRAAEGKRRSTEATAERRLVRSFPPTRPGSFFPSFIPFLLFL